MKNFIKKVAVVLSGALLLTALPLQANAKTAQWTKACKSYRAFLKNNVSSFCDNGDWQKKNRESYKKCSKFLVCDMNQDGTPELVTMHPTGYRLNTLYIYSFINSRVKKLKYINIDSPALGGYDVFKDRKGYLHTEWAGTMKYEGKTNSTYALRNGSVRCYLYYNCDPATGKKEYRKYDKSISASSYKKLASKLQTSGYMITNTVSGRKKCR